MMWHEHEWRSALSGVAIAAVTLTAACSQSTYQPAPLDTAASADRLLARDLGDPEMHAALAANGESIAGGWRLRALTVAAIHFDPALAAARAEWHRRIAAEASAAQRPNPLVEPELSYHSDPEGGDGPWTIGAAIAIPFLPEDKREARMALARADSEAARLVAAEIAWQRRGTVRDAVVACHRADSLLRLAAAEIALHREVVEIFERRRALGEANLTEVNLARRGADASHRDEAGLRAAGEACRGELASALGLPLAEVRNLALAYDGMMPGDAIAVPSAGMRRAALLGGLGIREALAAYAASEAGLRLAVARQYPDITLSPGLFWDQGGLLWALGGGLTAALLHNNEGPIAEAEAARRAAAQGVLAVQGRIVAALADADARLTATRVELEAAAALLDRRRERLAVAERRLQGGDVGRLEVTEAGLAVREAESAVLAARLDLIAVQAHYEDAVGLPLIGRRGPALDLEALALREPGWNGGIR